MDFVDEIEKELPCSDEEEDDSIVDSDTCTAFELEESFPQKYKIGDELALSLKKEFVLNLCSDSSFTRIAAGCSNGAVHIFDVSEQRGLSHSSLAGFPPIVSTSDPATICGVRFLDETSNCLLIGTTNGLVRLYDLRTNKEQARFEETTENNAKSFTSFDRNANGRILCVGTEQIQNEVFLIFYDVRQRQQSGCYCESHHDDVTAIRFHEVNPDMFCTGSTDGLINIFNIAEESEDDALLITINTDSSVQKLNWHKNIHDQDVISCITHTNDFKLYECQEGDLMAQFERLTVTEQMKRKAPENCNVVDCHNIADAGMFLLAGTNSNKGEVLRTLRLQDNQLQPLANFEGNKQIVRDSIFDAKSNVLVTAGESGIVTLWTPVSAEQTAALESSSNKLKSKTQLKSNKSTPY